MAASTGVVAAGRPADRAWIGRPQQPGPHRCHASDAVVAQQLARWRAAAVAWQLIVRQHLSGPTLARPQMTALFGPRL
jgi:hypothetical protein